MTPADSLHLDAWLGAIAVLIAALLGAVITVAVQHDLERRRRLQAARIEIYFKLLDLNSWYFWVASSQMRGEMPKANVLNECWRIGWQLSDQLRRADDVEQLDEILTILFDQTLPSANDRANRLGAVIDAYAKLVNPAYSKHMGRINMHNLHGTAFGVSADGDPRPLSFAPCTVDPSLRFTGADEES